jgi:hypothetical protein
LERRTSGDCPTICGYWTSDVLPVDASRVYRVSVWARASESARGVQLGVNIRFFDANGPIQEWSGFARTLNDSWSQMTGLVGPRGQTLLEGVGSWPEGTTGVLIDIAWLGSPARDGVEGDIWIDDVFFGPER